jgi:hypothetical protein
MPPLTAEVAGAAVQVVVAEEAVRSWGLVKRT